jgi:TonB family protein
MNKSPVLEAAALTLGLICSSAHAEWRCDCSTIVDTCSATITVEESSISIESDHRQCARVDYLIDGMPFVALVVDGSERQSWLNRSDDPQVRMQSCQVCVDNAAAPDPVTAIAGEPGNSPGAQAALPAEPREPSRLLAVSPGYPAAASASGTRGYVEVGFTVTALGRIEDPHVISAEPQGVFDQAALAAISRWRYNADEFRGPITLSHRFDFGPDGAIPSRQVPVNQIIDALIARSIERRDGPDPEAAPPAREPVDRNDCIREQASFNFGEMIEVDLMNTCSDPLIVYSCTEGMGRQYQRWVCGSTEKARNVLVQPGDRLVGSPAIVENPDADGMTTFTYTEDLFVARPPNSEYWWLACGVDDAECQDRGRHWVRSMDLRSASIDPSLWAEQSVARSF